MILLDTNVLIDAFDPAACFHQWASSLIRAGLLGEGVAINPVILAELCVGDDHPETVADRLEQLGVVLLDLPARTSQRCAQAFAGFLENRRKQTVLAIPKIPLPDFFIGAHAAFLNIPLATADVGRYRSYFPEVRLITPPEAEV
jgi:predicted nucleic acid-binding protein